MTTWININRNIVASNAKHGTNKPPIRVAKGKYGKPKYAHEIDIKGPCALVYNAGEPILPCGARLAIRTEADVKLKVHHA